MVAFLVLKYFNTLNNTSNSRKKILRSLHVHLPLLEVASKFSNAITLQFGKLLLQPTAAVHCLCHDIPSGLASLLNVL